jgi:hypothetical protein
MKTPRQGPCRNTPFPTVPLLLCFDPLLRESAYGTLCEQRIGKDLEGISRSLRSLIRRTPALSKFAWR